MYWKFAEILKVLHWNWNPRFWLVTELVQVTIYLYGIKYLPLRKLLDWTGVWKAVTTFFIGQVYYSHFLNALSTRRTSLFIFLFQVL